MYLPKHFAQSDRAALAATLRPVQAVSILMTAMLVVGGVGQLAGAVWAALGLGIFSKLLEGWAGAVIAKISILVCIIIFIQKRPQGLFALKGRAVEA